MVNYETLGSKVMKMTKNNVDKVVKKRVTLYKREIEIILGVFAHLDLEDDLTQGEQVVRDRLRRLEARF